MTFGYVLDTHVLIWLIEDSPKLSNELKELLERFNGKLFVPSVCVLETVDLILKRRCKLQLDGYIRGLRTDPRFEIVPADFAIAAATYSYADLADIHDRCIVATAKMLDDRHGDVILVTADRLIRLSPHVTTLWDK